MEWRVAAAVAGIGLALAAPGRAEVILSISGNADFTYEAPYYALPGAGRYLLELTSSQPAYLIAEYAYNEHWDIFRAPPPRPHSEYIEGNSAPFLNVELIIGTSFTLNFIVPETTRVFFSSGPIYEGYGVPLGTLLYRETRFEDPWINWYIESVEAEAFEYSVTLTRYGLIPEPSAWALMILGLGSAGVMLRRGRRISGMVGIRGP